MDVNPQPTGAISGLNPRRRGKHRLQPGVAVPGFGRVLATPDRYTVETILGRHGREVVGEEGQDR